MFMFNFYDLIFLFYFLGFLSFCMNRFHLLMILLSLEYMVLFMYLIIIIFLNFYEMELFFSMIFLTLTVCEGVLGLSILIMMVRMHGNDYYQTLSIL